MEKFVILPDVTCDLPQVIRDEFGINDYLKGHVHISDGRDFPTRLDWSEISRDDYYAALSSRKPEVTSAPPSPEEYYLTFKKYCQEGYKVLSVSISSKISSTYGVASLAAKRVMEEVEGSEIYCFDSFRMSGAIGLLVLYAQMLKNEGKGFYEVIEWLEANKHRVHQMGPIDDLMVVARRGRLSMGKAIMGSFAGVKPMGDCNRNGYVSVLGKAKGINRALDITAEYIKKTASEPQSSYALVYHTDRAAYAERLKGLLEERVGFKKVYLSEVFSGCATNIGTGMICAYYFGDEITEDMEKEKETMNELLNG